jgi:hypothetical protein
MLRILINKYFLFTVGSVCHVKQFSRSGKRFVDDEEIETGCESGWDSSQKTSILLVSTDW